MVTVAVAISVLTSVVGCASGESVEQDSADASFAEALVEAKEGGGSDAQLVALEEASQTETVTIEMARAAARRTVTCLNDAGLDAQYQEESLANGLVVPGYMVALPEGVDVSGSDSQINVCADRESTWIDKMYQTQASSIQQNEDYANERESVLRACLEENGISTDPDADGVDLANQASEVLGESENGINCLSEAGIDRW
jgi:hypothetical protein